MERLFAYAISDILPRTGRPVISRTKRSRASVGIECPLFDEAESRAILCSRLNALARGYSAKEKLEIELNSANDNPLFFESEEVFHGANFHGRSIAFVMDYITIALTQLGVLSERQTNRLLNRHLSDGLLEFLVAGEPGLSSGFAGVQYPAVALVAETGPSAQPASKASPAMATTKTW